MSDQLTKSLVAIIDEALAELDELKKSSRFSASEISLGEDDSKLHGAKKNGSLGKEEDKEEDEDEEEAKKADAMPEGTMAKDEDEEEEEDEEDEEEEEDEDEAKKADCGDEPMKKSSSEQLETLMKSYVDERISPIETKINSLFDLVKELADTPAPAKSTSYKNVTPLKKSADEEVQPLSKAEVANKLLELKKSGSFVDSADIVRAELAGPAELVSISSKYGLR